MDLNDKKSLSWLLKEVDYFLLEENVYIPCDIKKLYLLNKNAKQTARLLNVETTYVRNYYIKLFKILRKKGIDKICKNQKYN